MNDETSNPKAEQTQDPEREAWEEVGQQFKILGESLAEALRVAWDNPTTQQHVEDVKTGVEAMVNDVSKVMNETTASPKFQKARTEAEKAFDRAVAAGEQTVQETRPHLLNALRQLNEELRKWIEHLEQRQTKDQP
ncbi:MAG: hypothetical protein ACM3PY_03410 [Omnitrophica WOR_2 bacterium]